MKTLGVVLVMVMVCVLSGCATITGTVTGAFTGAVDLPAETYRHNRGAFEEHPILFAPDVLIVAPLGIVSGPLFGLAKGISLDVQCAIGQMEYDDVFGTYEEPSIWRPHTIQWPSKAGQPER